MQRACDELAKWSLNNCMNINVNKTSELFIGFGDINKHINGIGNRLNIGSLIINRVGFYKLLGVIVQDNLRWNEHVNFICSKASTRLFLLKVLKHSNLSNKDLLCFYICAIRTLLEYACEVFHSSLTAQQNDNIENIQKRALRIIYGYAFNYNELLILSGI